MNGQLFDWWLRVCHIPDDGDFWEEKEERKKSNWNSEGRI